MNQTRNHKKKMNFKFIIITFLFFSLTSLKSQTPTIDTIHESTNSIRTLKYAKDYIYWLELNNNKLEVFRKYNETVESQLLPESYSSCDFPVDFYAYQDFLYLRFAACAGINSQGFLWGATDTLIEDTLNLGSVCASYENLLLTQEGHIFDIETGMKTILNLDDGDEYYSPSNICIINDSFVRIKAFKNKKIGDSYVGDAIIQFDLSTYERKEIFIASNFVHFSSNHIPNGEPFSFTAEHSSQDQDSTFLYYYDGSQTHLVTQRHILNNYEYLNGVVYTVIDTLFYWEDGFNALLSTNNFSIENTEDCLIAWFPFNGQQDTLNIFDGNSYINLPLDGQDGFSSFFTSDNEIIFIISDLSYETNYILKVNHNLTCSETCSDSDLQIHADDDKSYLKSKSITSAAQLNLGNTIYKAQESIVLSPGFSTGSTYEFIAKIEECTGQSSLNKKENEREGASDLKEEYSENLFEKEGINKFSRIEQNNPNPYRSSTLIEYFIPENSKTGKISLYNFVGLKIKEININSFGTRGSVDIQMNHLAHGIYYYSLEVDSRIIDTKKMILIK